MERYEGSALRGRRGEKRPRGLACWVANQRLRRVTSRRRSIIRLHESGLKACVFPLFACEKRSTKRGFYKLTRLVSKSPGEIALIARGGYRFNL